MLTILDVFIYFFLSICLFLLLFEGVLCFGHVQACNRLERLR